MGREIRISIDDDEVFERMKARKRELDLSWEEVLHRGLRRSEHADHGGHPRGHDGHAGHPYQAPLRDPIGDPRGFAEDLKRQIQGQVRASLHSSLDPFSWDEPGTDPLDSDVTTLESAEDAVLRFEFLGDAAHDRRNQVPLRVTLEASADGLAVDVVAVRQGKTVTDMNAFEPATRRRIVERMAAGERATLSLADGEEWYPITPVLDWSRADGTPTVADVTIEEVHVDVE